MTVAPPRLPLGQDQHRRQPLGAGAEKLLRHDRAGVQQVNLALSTWDVTPLSIHIGARGGRGGEMQAYRIERFGSVDGIELRSNGDLRPGLREVLMRVR
jgi:hypothetical protein